jgi:small redox-active disulfide protein 2
MEIRIYGKGCAKCHRLAANVQAALAELGHPEVRVEHVQDLEKIAALGPVLTPALVVDGKVVSQGMALSARRVAELLRSLLKQGSEAQ